MRKNTFLNNYLKERFGCKVYKLALNGGMSCPNRDGTLGTGGCIFCSAGGSGEFTPDASLPIEQQLATAKELLSSKLPCSDSVKYIAYFQAYTNTYAPVSYLRRIFQEAISQEDIVGLSIATRPDVLPDAVLILLQELARQKMLWVELGLQTIHARTAEYIRRGYSLACFEEAVSALKKIGAEVVVHVILGLPGESREDMLETVRHLVHLKVDGIKLQLLHVLKGTDLADAYLAGDFEVLTMEEYVSIVRACLAVIPPEIVIHRVTGDGPRNLLLAPLWSTDKKRILNKILQE